MQNRLALRRSCIFGETYLAKYLKAKTNIYSPLCYEIMSIRARYDSDAASASRAAMDEKYHDGGES
ncbi:hypothetical protein I7I48_03403 [Histoplasma ohiense]|nr:hypothetical protein I7I48_03403 [Histoplasma ohiense (nom. inval.)]